MGFLGDLFGAMLNADYSDGVKCPVCNSRSYWDDDKTLWICSSCGYEIHGNQIELNEDGNIEGTLGIDWYCDECNEYLNNQIGFDAYGDTWICTECGCVNDITQNNVW